MFRKILVVTTLGFGFFSSSSYAEHAYCSSGETSLADYEPMGIGLGNDSDDCLSDAQFDFNVQYADAYYDCGLLGGNFVTGDYYEESSIMTAAPFTEYMCSALQNAKCCIAMSAVDMPEEPVVVAEDPSTVNPMTPEDPATSEDPSMNDPMMP